MSLFGGLDERPARSRVPRDLVLCAHCNDAYQLGGVQEVHRYSDCTVFIAPCCGRQVDSREFKATGPDFERIGRSAFLDLLDDVRVYARRDGVVQVVSILDEGT